jgi:hypothetical protein
MAYGNGDWCDLMEDLGYPIEISETTIFADPHFFLEMQDVQQSMCRQSYKQYMQGTMALTPQGVELARHFFNRIAEVIENPDVSLVRLFEQENLAWVPTPATGSAWCNDIMFNVASGDDAVWTQVEEHPLFHRIYKFRFLITISSRFTGELRQIWPFTNVNAARVRTVRRCSGIMTRQPYTYMRPNLTPEETILLLNFQWD